MRWRVMASTTVHSYTVRVRFGLAVLIAIVGCSAGSETPSASSSAADSGSAVVAETASPDDAAKEVGATDAAPACPNEVGDVICDLPLEGHVRDGIADGLATEAPYITTTLYEVLARGTQKYALIWTSGYW
jgi:hypothetical protein